MKLPPSVERVLFTKSHVIMMSLFVFQCVFLFVYEIYFTIKIKDKSQNNKSNKIFKVYCQIAYTIVAMCFIYYSIILKNIYELFLFLAMSTYSVIINTYEIFLCIDSADQDCTNSNWVGIFLCLPMWIPEICFYGLAYFVYKNFKYEKFKSRRSDLTKKEKSNHLNDFWLSGFRGNFG